jgi:hypothetical protein
MSNWPFVGGILHALSAILLFAGLLTFPATPVLKYFSPTLSWISTANISFWSVFAALSVASVIDLVMRHLGLAGYSLVLSLLVAAMCATGSLLTCRLGIDDMMHKRLPATNARIVATSLLIASLTILAFGFI